jgi:transcriptional regulator with XRE-family HTH domain
MATIAATATDVGTAVREARLRAGLTQEEAARRAAVSRRWSIDLERGHSNAQLDKVLHTLRVLGLGIEIVPFVLPARNRLDDLVESTYL